MEEQKHNISVLVELVLYPRIRAIDESYNTRAKEKEQMKRTAIKDFIKECSERSKIMTNEQIEEHVINKLSQMIKSNEDRLER